MNCELGQVVVQTPSLSLHSVALSSLVNDRPDIDIEYN